MISKCLIFQFHLVKIIITPYFTGKVIHNVKNVLEVICLSCFFPLPSRISCFDENLAVLLTYEKVLILSWLHFLESANAPLAQSSTKVH